MYLMIYSSHSLLYRSCWKIKETVMDNCAGLDKHSLVWLSFFQDELRLFVSAPGCRREWRMIKCRRNTIILSYSFLAKNKYIHIPSYKIATTFFHCVLCTHVMMIHLINKLQLSLHTFIIILLSFFSINLISIEFVHVVCKIS
jgi:hypothetical protein